MPEYVIAPMEVPPWKLEPADFARRLQERWPTVRIGIDDVAGSQMKLHALIPFPGRHRELGVALSDSGQYVSLDPADPETAAEFVTWFVQQVPSQKPPIHIVAKDDWRPLLVTQITSRDDVIAHFSS